MRVLKASLVAVLAFWVLPCGSTLQSDEGDPVGDFVAGAVDLDSWPRDVETLYGYSWRKGDFSALDGYSVDSDVSHVTDVHWVSDEIYAGLVVRTITLRRDSPVLLVKLTCAKDYNAAKSRVLDKHRPASLLSASLGYGPSFGVEVGDVSVINDVPILDREEFDGNNTRNMLFIRGNLVVELALVGEGETGLNVVELAQAVDAKILLQHKENEGNPAAPTLDVTLGADEFDLSGNDESVSADLAVSATMDDGSRANTRGLVSSKEVRSAIDENGVETPGPYFSIFIGGEGIMLDDPAAPTKLTATSTTDHGDWNLVIVAWGDNLYPAYSVTPFSVIR